MYATLSMFFTPSEYRVETLRAADTLYGSAIRQKGLHNIIFLVDPENHEYGVLALWKTKADLDNAERQTANEDKELLHSIGADVFSKQVYEVYEPTVK